LKQFVDIFAQTSSEASRVNRAIIEAGDQLSAEASSVAGAIARVADQLSDLVRQVREASSLAAEIPQALYEPARVARELASGLESATPVALVFKDGSEQMRTSIETLGKIVGELKYAAEQYRVANDQHRRHG
jgi:methyl-accepting chemotaxis protein